MKVMKTNLQPTVPPRTALDHPKRRNDDGDVTMHVHDGGYSKKRQNSLRKLLPNGGNRNRA